MKLTNFVIAYSFVFRIKTTIYYSYSIDSAMYAAERVANTRA